MAASKTRRKPLAKNANTDAGLYLQKSSEQIHSAAAETQAEIDGMARLVISLAEHVVGLSTQLDRLEQTSLHPEDMRSVRDEVASLDAVSNKTIARLQFAERLNRRLMTVQKNLTALAEILSQDDEQGANAHETKPSKLRLTLAQQERLMQKIVDEPAANDENKETAASNVTWVSNDGWGKLSH